MTHSLGDGAERAIIRTSKATRTPFADPYSWIAGEGDTTHATAPERQRAACPSTFSVVYKKLLRTLNPLHVNLGKENQVSSERNARSKLQECVHLIITGVSIPYTEDSCFWYTSLIYTYGNLGTSSLNLRPLIFFFNIQSGSPARWPSKTRGCHYTTEVRHFSHPVL